MFNLGNKAGKIRISLAALALFAGSIGVSQVTGLAQKGNNSAPAQQPPQSESTKARLQREEDEAKNRKPGTTPGVLNSPAAGGAELDGVGGGGTPRRDGDPSPVIIGAGAGKNAPQIIPDDGFITITGSTGQLSAESVALADFRNYELGFRNTAPRTTGAIAARYNITAVKDALRTTGTATNNYQLKIRFRDDDGMGNVARVIVTVNRAGVDTGSGGGETLATFDSNIFPAIATQSFRTATATLCPSVPLKLDFGNYVYWLEVRITRTDPNVNANFGSLQFTELETACTP